VLFLTSVSLLTVVTTLSSFAVVMAFYEKAILQLQTNAPAESLLDHVVSEWYHNNNNNNNNAPPPAVREWEFSARILGRVIRELPVTVVFGSFTALCAWSLVSLLLYHMRIISIAQTTNERVRGVYLNPSENPWDQGCQSNWRKCCHNACHPPPSRLPRDFSEIVVEDANIIESPWTGDLQQQQHLASSRSQTSLQSGA
jgi:hypothetical protein